MCRCTELRFYVPKNNIPFEKGLPLLGNLIPYSKDRLSWLSKLSDKHGEVFKVKVGPKEIHVAVGKDYVRHIMVKNSQNYIKKTNFEMIFGKSLFITNGAEWKRQRQLLTPLMNLRYLESCLPMMDEIITKNLHQFEDSLDNGKNLRNLFSKITFDIIMSCVIGLDYEDDYEHIDKGLAVLTSFVTREKYAVFNLPGKLDKEKKDFDFYMQKLDDVIYNSIKKTNKDKLSFSFMNQLLEFRDKNPEEKISDTFIRDNIVTVMFAGYETSALSLSFMMDLLLENPHWLNRCTEEMRAFNLEINFESLQQLPITEACLFEAMRLYPAGWGFTREAENDDEMHGISVKQGDIFLVSPFLTQRSSLYWDNPETFDPNRFLGKKITEELRQIYFPFGLGPRMCSGMNFALMEMKLILLRLLKNYQILRTGDRPLVDARATLMSKNGFQMMMAKNQN